MPEGREDGSSPSEAEKERKQMDEASRHRAELDALQATVLDITGQQELSTMLYAIVERSVQLLKARSGAMYMCDPERKEVRLTVSYKISRDFTGTVLKYGEGAAGIAAETGKPVMLDDYRKWQGRASVFEEDRPFTAVLSVPMIWQGRILGVIDVMDDVESRRFMQEDQELLTLFANHAAIAVQRQQTEQKLRLQSEIAENMFEGVVLTRASDGVIVYANSRFEKMFGYGSGELVGKNIATVNAPTNGKSPEDVYGEIQSILNIHGSWSGEVYNARKDGTFFWCRANISTLESSEYGRVWVETHDDITERKQMEDEIRNLARFPSENPNPVLRLDKEGRVLTANQASKALLEEWNCELGQTAPRFWRDLVTEALSTGQNRNLDVEFGGRCYTFLVKPIVETSNVNFYGRDITERKHSEETRSRLAAIVESSDDAIIGKTLDGIITSWNEGAEKTYGYSADESVGKSVSILLPPGRQGELKEILERVRRGEPVQHFESERVRKDGRVISISLTVSPIRDSADQIIGASTIARDITQQKSAELALRESEERFREAMEATSDGLWDWNVETGEIYYSPGYYRMLGYEPGELPGLAQTWMDLIHPDEREQVLQSNQDCIENRVPNFKIEFRIRTKSGGWKWILGRGKANARDANGRALRMIGTHEDITERKRAELELRRQGEELQTIFDSVPAMIFQLDREHKLVHVNRAYVEAVGLPKEKLEGRSTLEVFPHQADSYWRDDDEVMTSGRPKRDIVEAFETAGGTRWAQTDKIPHRNVDGDVTGVLAFALDITERKKMEEELRRLSQFRESVIDNAHVWIDVLDEKANVVVWNKAAEAISGYSREEVIGHDRIWGWLYPDEEYRTRLTALVADVVRHGRVEEDFETTIRCKDGQVRIISWNERSLMDELGKTIGSIALGRDVTEHKKMEEELKRYSTQLEKLVAERTRELAASKDFAENLIQTANAIVVGLDNKGNIRILNQAAERITGYTSRELEGRSWFEVIVPKDRYPEVWREFERLTAGGLPKNFENPILTKSGEERYVVWQNNEVREQGQAVGTISFGIDITERKRAEEQLRVARERLEYVITSSPAVIFTGKPRPDLSNFDATYLSKSVVSLLGFEPEYYIEIWNDRVHPEDLRRYLAEVPLLWKDGQHTFEYRFLHKNGTYRWIREEAKVVRDTDGKPIEVNGYWTDVSERKRLEEELADSQRLATIGETAAMVGHDLRNPLQGIAGIVYLAKRDLESRKAMDRKAAAALLDIIQEQVVYMDKIVSDLQDYSQPLAPKLTETNLPNLIRQTLSTIKVPAAVKVSVEVEKAAQTMMIDPTLMRRTLTNLTINAIQAMPKRGKLTIRARSKRDSTVMTVEDTGAGIPRKNLARLFSPFFTTKAKGQGLGLAVCKRLVETQGGTIVVKSRPRKGTTFTIKLPRGRKEVAS